MEADEKACQEFMEDYDLAKRLGTVDQVFIKDDGAIRYRNPRKGRGH